MRGISIKPLLHGHMDLDKEMLVTTHPDGFTTGDSPNFGNEMCVIPSVTYIIDHPQDGRLIFDASISPHWDREWLPEWQAAAPWTHTEQEIFENALKTQGIGPEDVDIAFLSHLHCDHAGNARLFNTSGTKIMMHDDEFRAAADRTEDENFFLRADYELPGAKYNLLPGDTEIMKDVFAISLPGHTPGLMGLMIHLEHAGTIILASDACYHKDSYEKEIGSMISADQEQWLSSMHKLKMLARCHNATVIPGHSHTTCQEGGEKCPLHGEDHVRMGGEYT